MDHFTQIKLSKQGLLERQTYPFEKKCVNEGPAMKIVEITIVKQEVSKPLWLPWGIQLAYEMETKSRTKADGCVRMLLNQEVMDPPKAI